MKKRFYWLYVTFIVDAKNSPMVLVRLPKAPTRWREVQKQLGTICRFYGGKSTYIALDALCDPDVKDMHPLQQMDNDRLVPRVEAAFRGNAEYLSGFNLWAWNDTTRDFNLVRKATSGVPKEEFDKRLAKHVEMCFVRDRQRNVKNWRMCLHLLGSRL